MTETITMTEILQWAANLAVIAVAGLYKMHNKLRADFESCKQEQARTYMPRAEIDKIMTAQTGELRDEIHRLADKIDRLYELHINRIKIDK